MLLISKVTLISALSALTSHHAPTSLAFLNPSAAHYDVPAAFSLTGGCGVGCEPPSRAGKAKYYIHILKKYKREFVIKWLLSPPPLQDAGCKIKGNSPRKHHSRDEQISSFVPHGHKLGV